jgi:hypothetical protein
MRPYRRRKALIRPAKKPGRWAYRNRWQQPPKFRQRDQTGTRKPRHIRQVPVSLRNRSISRRVDQ